MRRLTDAFEAVIFAQVKISTINTTLTAIYLLGGLRLFGVRLPLAGTLILVTFLTGLIPVVGNLVSNTVRVPAERERPDRSNVNARIGAT